MEKPPRAPILSLFKPRRRPSLIFTCVRVSDRMWEASLFSLGEERHAARFSMLVCCDA